MRPVRGSGDRAQAIQLGALLLFAILIINLSLYQVFVVPDQNGEIEFKHNQQVQEELTTARDLSTQSVASDSELSTSIRLAPQYPSRALFVNPGPPSGTLETVDRGDLVLENVQPLNDETADAWSGDKTFSDRKALVYRPSYNVYASAPTTVYGSSVLYNVDDDGGVRNRTGQTIVSGNRITLLSMSGSMGRTTSGAETIEFQPTSAPTRRVPVEPDGTFAIEFNTTIPESVWEDELLAGQIDEGDNDPDAYVTNVTMVSGSPPSSVGTLNITFEPDKTYTLRMGQVSVGNNVDDESASYITKVDPTADSLSVTENGEREVVVEVRDRYNNPVSGVPVTVDDPSGAGEVTASEATTDERGRASFVYKGDSVGGPEVVTFTIPDDSYEDGTDGTVDGAEEVNYTATVNPAPGSGTSNGDGADYGTGGSSNYDDTNDTQTVSVPNGKWSGLTATDELILSSGESVYDTSNSENRIEYALTFRNTTTGENFTVKYVAKIQPNSGFQEHKVYFDPQNGNDPFEGEPYPLVYQNVIESTSAYRGADLLDATTYKDPGDDVNTSIRDIKSLAGEDTVVITSEIRGRVDATIREEALFSAVQPDPSDGSDLEFVRVGLESPTNTTKWKFGNDATGRTTLPSKKLSGDIYFARDEAAFEDERGFSDDKVYPLDTTLATDGESLTLRDSQGRIRDEMGYNRERTDKGGWTIQNINTGDVAVRKQYASSSQDNDTRSDWRTASQMDFFGSSGPSVAFVPNSDQRLIRTVSPDGTVVDYGRDPSQVKILGPKADLNDDGIDEVLYVGGNDGDVLRYMETDGNYETLVDSKVQQDSALGIGDPDGDGLKTVYYAVSNGKKLKKIEVGGGSAQRVSPGNGNSKVSAKGGVGYADANGDGDDDIIYLPSGTSDEIGYVDNGSTNTTEIGPRGNRYQIGDGNAVGEPVTINGSLRVPIVNGSQDLLLVDPGDGSNFETVNRGNVKPKKSPITVRDWRGDDTKEILVINGNDNQHLYYVEVNTGGNAETGEVRDEEAKDKGVR